MRYPRDCFIRSLCAVAGLALIAPARAEEPRYVPAAGTALTYKVVNTNTVAPNPPFTTGWTLVYKVKSSDDLTWEGSIELKTSYVSPVCPEHNCDKFNQEAEQAHARKEGDLFAIDLPGNIADELSKLSAVRYRYLVRELEQFPFPRMGQGGFDQGPSFVLSTRLECDKALLASFFPLGKTPRVAVPCTQSVERSNVHPPMKESPPQKSDVTLELAYEGKSRVTTAAGEWAVQNVRVTSTQPSTQAILESEIQFSEQLGAIVKSHTVSRADNARLSGQSDRELIAISR